jgi:secondary thiamine-phosphate synthase enzyme
MSQVHTDSFEIVLKVGPDIIDITGYVEAAVKRAGVSSGQASVFMVGSTGSITTIEYEPGVVEDFKNAVNRVAPQGMEYAHEKAWRDGNGHSHVQAALLGPSVTIPIRNGRLRLGTWQQVVAVNHDNRSRQRTVEVTVIGEAS